MKTSQLLRTSNDLTNRELQKAEDFNEQRDDLLSMAKVRSQEIKPCAGSKSFDTCITAHNKKLILWYNDKSGSTRVVEKEV